jgi:predicted Fe-S protein YdhL (DUF1289 family)
MAFFPRIQSPCPYKSDLAAVMDGDFCRMCKRTVFDLTDMTDGERRALLAGCGEEVCVSYRVRPAAVAAALAAAAMPAAAAAQDLGPAVPGAAAIAAQATEIASLQELDIIVGGIRDPANARYVEHDAGRPVPELPVAYEDEADRAGAPAAQPAAAGGAD